MSGPEGSSFGEYSNALVEAWDNPPLEVEIHEDRRTALVEGELIVLEDIETDWLEELVANEAPVGLGDVHINGREFDSGLAKFVKVKKGLNSLAESLKEALGREAIIEEVDDEGRSFYSLVPASREDAESLDSSENGSKNENKNKVSDSKEKDVKGSNENTSGDSTPTVMNLPEGSGLLLEEDKGAGTSNRPTMETENPKEIGEAEQKLQDQVKEHLLTGENGLPEEGLSRKLVKRAYYEIIADPDREVTEDVVSRMKELRGQLRKAEGVFAPSSSLRSNIQVQVTQGGRSHPAQTSTGGNGHKEKSPKELLRVLEFDVDDETWMIRARCLDADPDTFFRIKVALFARLNGYAPSVQFAGSAWSLPWKIGSGLEFGVA